MIGANPYWMNLAPTIPAAPSQYSQPAYNYFSQTLPAQIHPAFASFTGTAGKVAPYVETIPDNISQAVASLITPNQTPAKTAYNLAFLVSSGIVPIESLIYGGTTGAIGTASNMLFPTGQTNPQAFGTSYKFGAATTPLFMGAGELGGLITGAGKTVPNIANPYLRFLAGTAPVSTVYGGLQAGQGYMQGQTKPIQELENFGMGYGLGTLLQGATELGVKYSPIKYGNIDFTNPLYEGKSLYFENPLTGDITPLLSSTSTPSEI